MAELNHIALLDEQESLVAFGGKTNSTVDNNYFLIEEYKIVTLDQNRLSLAGYIEIKKKSGYVSGQGLINGVHFSCH